ncbi:MAG: PAS domain-containing protein [Candidatus Omnitrophica bacterium]|nr:PAS domain-containing protein [Candidatus Omnitrophota bacterium]
MPEAAEQELSEPTVDYETLLKAITEGVCLCDPDGRLLMANKALLDLVDAKADDMIGKLLPQLFVPQSRQAIEEALAQVTTQRAVKGIEANAATSNGVTLPVSVGCSLLKPTEEDTPVILVRLKDLSREKKLSEELSRTQSESESLLAELDEAYRQLKGAQEELVRRERLAASGELAAGVAHEIRNPLSIIGMSIQYLHSKLSPGHAFREFTSAIIKKVERLDKITTQLISYGRPRELKLEARDVHRNLNQVLRLASPKCKAQGVKIVRRVDRKLPKVTCDHDLMDQVFTNLVTNALEAMPNGGGVLTVETQLDREKQQAIVSIADTGRGIPPKVQAQLFKPFFTTKRNGTGLGLAISHRIIDHHHGTITCASKTRGSQRGTTFTIRLPITPPAKS